MADGGTTFPTKQCAATLARERTKHVSLSLGATSGQWVKVKVSTRSKVKTNSETWTTATVPKRQTHKRFQRTPISHDNAKCVRIFGVTPFSRPQNNNYSDKNII